MNSLTAIRDYLRWIRHWHVDYTADDWREQNEQRWDAFCRWRAGELPGDIGVAIAIAQMMWLYDDILDGFGNLADHFNQVMAGIVGSFAKVAEAMNNIGLPTFAESADNGVDRE